MEWKNFLGIEKKSAYFIKIFDFIAKRKKLGYIIYPPYKDIFNAFKFTSFSKIKVVILGQDPYLYRNQANGLAFSVNYGIKVPPTLLNIYKEIERNITNFKIPNHGYLKNWAVQGIMLLNTLLTVEHGKPCSHANIGWEIFTDRVINILSKNKKDIIFLLWGQKAKEKEFLINSNHVILKASHPSPFSVNYGFKGCKHFSKINEILLKKNQTPINWNLGNYTKL